MRNYFEEEQIRIVELRQRMSRAGNKEGRWANEDFAPGLKAEAFQVRAQRPVFHEQKTILLRIIKSANSHSTRC